MVEARHRHPARVARADRRRKETVDVGPPDGGRSFGFSGLHFHENWRVPEYRRILTQGILWTVKLPIPEKGLPVDVKDEELKLK